MSLIKTVKIAAVFAVLAGMTLVTGCASMFGDNTRNVVVNSEPKGAQIYVEGVQYGTTPSVVTLPSYIYGGKIVTLKKKGYQDQSLMINSKFQPVSIWNILNGFGWIIDAATGNIVKIDPANLNVNATLTPGSNN